MAGQDCRCVICGCCRHDHGGWNHKWKPKEITMPVRAKFRCQFETNKRWGQQDDQVTRSYEFSAVYDADLPEDQRFAKATPVGTLTMQVDNPAVTFEIGKQYYLDITPVDEAASA